MLPEALLRSLATVPGYDERAFRETHGSGEQVTSLRLNPSKINDPQDLDFEGMGFEPIPWAKYGFYLSERPSFTFDPLFHAGCYYVQEASSMFIEQILRSWTANRSSLRILDLSAAPGGKSTHIQSLVTGDSLLISNEVIRSRANVLVDNIIKWGASNVVVTNNDPRAFSSLQNFFDIIVIDAPCSGSGLFRRDPSAIDEWSENNVQLCSGRQQRILGDVWPALKPGGLLVYSTCSYSMEEDEMIAQWLMNHFSLEPFEISVPAEWNITATTPGYRFWPHLTKGEGFYVSAFVKKEGNEDPVKRRKASSLERVSKREKETFSQWIDTVPFELIKAGNNVYAWPLALREAMEELSASLQVIYSGVRTGQLMKDKLIPDHALALSEILPAKIPRIELQKPQAIDYLSRKDIHIEQAQRGWHVVCFEAQELGWINVLEKRINNYYPKEMRIRKEFP